MGIRKKRLRLIEDSTTPTDRVAKIVGNIFFGIAIAAQLLFGIMAFIAVVGMACIISGVFTLYEGKIGVGIEGRTPSFYITGSIVFLFGIALILLGILMLVFPSQVVSLLE